MSSGSLVLFECLTVLKQAMLVAIAVAASTLVGWPDTVCFEDSPTMFFSLSPFALLR